jgi:uncharacterized membrane protein YccC
MTTPGSRSRFGSPLVLAAGWFLVAIGVGALLWIQRAEVRREQNYRRVLSAQVHAYRQAIETLGTTTENQGSALERMDAYLKVRDDWITEENSVQRQTHARILRLLREIRENVVPEPETDPDSNPEAAP